MVCLVTGCCGFIGYYVSKALLDRGDVVIGIDNLNSYYDVNLKLSRLFKLRIYDNFNFSTVDITDIVGIKEIFNKYIITHVCHLAAQAGVRYSIENPYVYQQSNLAGFQNMIGLSKDNGIKNFVYASSSSVYGNSSRLPFSEDDFTGKPLSIYAATKVSNEQVAHVYNHLFGLRTIGLRYFTVYGPYGRPDMALFLFTDAILNDRPIEVFNHGDMRRAFTYVSDVVSATLAALDSELVCEIINVGGEEAVQLTDYIKIIESCVGKEAEKKFLPMQPGDVKETVADVSKAIKLLGYKPEVGVEEGVSRFVKWYIDYYRK